MLKLFYTIPIALTNLRTKQVYSLERKIQNIYTQQADAIPLKEIIDLTAKMKPDGGLEWTRAGQGDWMIIRFGYSLTGRQNHPASPEATGLEVDKLDNEAVRKYINTYLDMYKDATGGMMGTKGLHT